MDHVEVGAMPHFEKKIGQIGNGELDNLLIDDR
jgi:hypothetical protein